MVVHTTSSWNWISRLQYWVSQFQNLPTSTRTLNTCPDTLIFQSHWKHNDIIQIHQAVAEEGREGREGRGGRGRREGGERREGRGRKRQL